MSRNQWIALTIVALLLLYAPVSSSSFLHQLFHSINVFITNLHLR